MRLIVISLVLSLGTLLLYLSLTVIESAADLNFGVARRKQFPFIASITTEKNYRNITCVGSLIDRHWILTTASCVYQNSIIYITLGKTKQNGEQKGEQFLTIDDQRQIFVHADFDPRNLIHNIALIKINQKITLNEFVKTIECNKAESIDPDGYVLGWAFGNNYADQKYDRFLHYQFVHTMDYDECLSFHKGFINSYCTMAADSKTCFPEQGTPYIRYEANTKNPKLSKFLLFGLGYNNWLSNNETCGNPPPVFLDVSQYEVWIKSITKLKL